VADSGMETPSSRTRAFCAPIVTVTRRPRVVLAERVIVLSAVPLFSESSGACRYR